MNPLEQYLEEKKAGFMDTVSKGVQGVPGKIPGAISGALAGAAVAGGGQLIATGAQKIMDAISKRFEFKQMLDHNPDLEEHLESNPKFFNQAYSSLRSLSPQFAKDPIVAGTYMREMMSSPLHAGGKIMQAFSETSKVREPTSMTQAGFLEGAKSGLSSKDRGAPRASFEGRGEGE